MKSMSMHVCAVYEVESSQKLGCPENKLGRRIALLFMTLMEASRKRGDGDLDTGPEGHGRPQPLPGTAEAFQQRAISTVYHDNLYKNTKSQYGIPNRAIVVVFLPWRVGPLTARPIIGPRDSLIGSTQLSPRLPLTVSRRRTYIYSTSLTTTTSSPFFLSFLRFVHCRLDKGCLLFCL